MAIPQSPLAKAVRHLEAGEWKAAHAIVQKDTSTAGCWAHGIVHLIEGDLDNAQYWYRRARRPMPHLDTVTAEIAALKDALTRERRRELRIDATVRAGPARDRRRGDAG
jgi:hypothetical protein